MILLYQNHLARFHERSGRETIDIYPARQSAAVSAGGGSPPDRWRAGPFGGEPHLVASRRLLIVHERGDLPAEQIIDHKPGLPGSWPLAPGPSHGVSNSGDRIKRIRIVLRQPEVTWLVCRHGSYRCHHI